MVETHNNAVHDAVEYSVLLYPIDLRSTMPIASSLLNIIISDEVLVTSRYHVFLINFTLIV